MRRLLLSWIIFISAIAFPLHSLFGQTSITATINPNAIADGGGTGSTGYPYAVLVTIQNWAASAGSQAYLKIYFNTNNEFMWSATGVWSNSTTYSNANQPVVDIDASGNWSGWIYAKHNTNLGVTPRVRAAKVGATSTNLTSNAVSVSVLTMTTSGDGGWIVRQTSPAEQGNRRVLRFDAGRYISY